MSVEWIDPSRCDKRRPPEDDAEYFDGLPRCKNCGEDYFEHWDDESGRVCKMQPDSVYGSFCGGDPRNFSPDPECSSPQEQENHRKACAEAEVAENPNLPCPSGWERLPDGTVSHTLRLPFGLGVTFFPTQYYEPKTPHAD